MNNPERRDLRNFLRKGILARHADLEALLAKRERDVHSVDERGLADCRAAGANLAHMLRRAGGHESDLEQETAP
jgi:hypothetical protein